MGIENPVHILFVAAVALIVLGPRRLPELARAVGRGVREFREALGAERSEEAPEPPPALAPAPSSGSSVSVAGAPAVAGPDPRGGAEPLGGAELP